MVRTIIILAAVATIAALDISTLSASVQAATSRVCYRGTYGTRYCSTPRYLRQVNKQRGIGYRQTGGNRY